MKAIFALSAAALLPLTALRAQTPSPYVETTTLTFYWGFTSDYVTNNVTSAPPTLPELVPPFDPNTLPSGFESYTDTITVQAYTGPIIGHFAPAGSNRQLIDLLLQRMVRSGRIDRRALGFRWQLIGVREAPANVREMATNPYRVFLSVQAGNSTSATNFEVPAYAPEHLADDPVADSFFFSDTTPGTAASTLDTGITITLGQYNGSYTESKWGTNATSGKEWVRNASGNVATAFRVNFGALFYDDPLHALNPGAARRDPYNFHLRRHHWEASASGLINYGIRSVAGPLPTFVATNATATGTGWFSHLRTEYVFRNGAYELQDGITQTYGMSGIAPLKVTLSTIQYQKRSLFLLDIPSAPSAPSAETISDTSVRVSWSHFTDFDTGASANAETGFRIERKEGLEGEWEEIVLADANAGTFLDTELDPDTIYFYRIAAFNGAGASAFTDEVVASTISAPSDLVASAVSATEIKLTWKDNADAVGRQEIYFELQRRGPEEDDEWETITDEDDILADVETFPDTELASSTKYTYRIRAVDEYGASAWSEEAEATTPAPAAEAEGGGDDTGGGT
jgi:hypothetical protein